MGLGDWIMATAQVRETNERTGKPVVVVDRMGRVRWSEAFEGNPRIARNVTPQNSYQFARLLNAGGARPYIRAKTETHWYWRTWDIKPGELYLSDAERAFGATLGPGAIIVEPNTKVRDGNKAWPFVRWEALVRALPGLNWWQIGPPGIRMLSGTRFLETTVRQAFGAIGSARLFVGTDGALHHAAAALGTQAVVLWSEFVSPAFVGYATQRNIRKTAGVCGSRLPCKTCRASMDAITVDEVAAAIQEELAK